MCTSAYRWYLQLLNCDYFTKSLVVCLLWTLEQFCLLWLDLEYLQAINKDFIILWVEWHLYLCLLILFSHADHILLTAAVAKVFAYWTHSNLDKKKRQKMLHRVHSHWPNAFIMQSNKVVSLKLRGNIKYQYT